MRINFSNQSLPTLAKSGALARPSTDTSTDTAVVDKTSLEVRGQAEPTLTVKKALKVLVPVGLGVYGGLAVGRFAGIGAAVAATPALVVGGIVAGNFVSQDLFGQGDGHQTASAIIGGGIGLGLGTIGAYCLAKSQSGIGLAVGLGVAGVASAVMGKFLKS